MSALPELTIAKVIQACGTIDGRVKLQKIVYLLTAMGYELPFRDFRVRHYGPFSPRLAAALDFLVDTGVVEECAHDVGGESPRYDYMASPSFGDLLNQYVDIPPPEHKPALEEVTPQLTKLDRSSLEVAATMCFLRYEEALLGEELQRELRELKGHLGEFPASARRAEMLLKELGLPVS